MGFVASGPADDVEEDIDSLAKMEDACLFLAGWGWVVERYRLRSAVKADAVDSAIAATAMGHLNRPQIMILCFMRSDIAV